MRTITNPKFKDFIELKKGDSFTDGTTTWVVLEDVKNDSSSSYLMNTVKIVGNVTIRNNHQKLTTFDWRFGNSLNTAEWAANAIIYKNSGNNYACDKIAFETKQHSSELKWVGCKRCNNVMLLSRIGKSIVCTICDLKDSLIHSNCRFCNSIMYNDYNNSTGKIELVCEYHGIDS